MSKEVSTQLELQEDFNNLIDTLEEIKAQQKDRSHLKDKRDPLVIASTQGKIDRLKAMLDIVTKQAEDDMTFDQFESYVAEKVVGDLTYSAVEYYHNDIKLMDAFSVDVLNMNIEQLEMARNISHMKDNLKMVKYPIDKSKVKSKVKKSMTKLYTKLGQDRFQLHLYNLDLMTILDVLIETAPSGTNYHNRFIYSLCQYIDKYYVELPFMVVEELSLLKGLSYNKEVMSELNVIYNQ